ncbi:MAG: hypothetical protein U9R42_14350 [Bacteroidota bacterium]|nr:hypothetical protein [Bacteroidota bacterium]
MEKTPLHFLGFIYVGFAELTDNEFSDEEHEKVVELVLDWKYNEKEIHKDEFSIILSDIMTWYEGIKEKKLREKMFFEAVVYVQQQYWFTPQVAKEILDNLVEVMKADSISKTSEKDMLKKLALIWSVDYNVE